METELKAAISALLLGAVAYAGKLGKMWFDAKLKDVEQRTKERDEYLLRGSLADAAQTASAMVERTFVKARKETGTWDESSKIEARARAITVAERLLSERTRRLAKEQNVNVIDLLTIYIEGGQ